MPETLEERKIMPRLDTNKGIWKAILSLLLLLAAAKPRTAWAQAESSITGTVADTTGAVISGATVRVKNLEVGTVRTLITDNQGRYTASSLAVGRTSIRHGGS